MSRQLSLNGAETVELERRDERVTIHLPMDLGRFAREKVQSVHRSELMP